MGGVFADSLHVLISYSTFASFFGSGSASNYTPPPQFAQGDGWIFTMNLKREKHHRIAGEVTASEPHKFPAIWCRAQYTTHEYLGKNTKRGVA